MFQTDTIRLLQSFYSEILTNFMKAITALGYEQFFVLLIIAIMAGVDFRKGFIVLQVLIITGLLTSIAKEYFALPRPWFVDSSLNTFGNDLSTNYKTSGASTFFSMLPQHIINSYRELKPDSFGFPSGHTSTAIALWGTIIILFKSRWIQITSVSLIILIPLSRLYLARHFPADLIGGYLLGAVVLVFAWVIILNKSRLKSYLNSEMLSIDYNIKTIGILSYLFIIPVMFYLVLPAKVQFLPGYLLGANIAYLLIARSSYPGNPGRIKKSIIAILITLIVFAIFGFTLNQLFKYIFEAESSSIVFIKSALIIFFGILISIKINTILFLHTKTNR